MLAARIRATGPVSIAEYMAGANEAYYGSRDPLGVAGDFITAPEISQMFGEFVGLWFADLWMKSGSPGACHYVELGPGRGTMAADALRSMRRFELEPVVHFVEMSEALRAHQRLAMPTAVFHENVETLPREGPLLVIANEFFDALPVRQFVRTEGGWRERMVTLDDDDGLIATDGQGAVDGAIARHLRDAPAGTIVETCPAATTMLFDLAGRINVQGGALLIVDYGYDAPGAGDTLQAVHAHRAADVFARPGEQDLSAHVNFPELTAIAQMREAAVYGPVRQGDWLRSLGIDVRCDRLIATNPARAEALRAAHDRLTSPYQMGALFKVMAITGGQWSAPEGFA